MINWLMFWQSFIIFFLLFFHLLGMFDSCGRGYLFTRVANGGKKSNHKTTKQFDTTIPLLHRMIIHFDMICIKSFSFFPFCFSFFFALFTGEYFENVQNGKFFPLSSPEFYCHHNKSKIDDDAPVWNLFIVSGVIL